MFFHARRTFFHARRTMGYESGYRSRDDRILIGKRFENSTPRNISYMTLIVVVDMIEGESGNSLEDFFKGSFRG